MARRTWLWFALPLAACTPASPPASSTPAPPPTPGLAPKPGAVSADAAVHEDGGAPASPSAPPSAGMTETPPPAPTPAAPAVSHEKTARCQRDDQCALALDYHCCGECRAVPLTAISAAADRKAQKDSARHCAVMDVDCSEFHCAKMPPKCEARAVCSKGWCQVTVSRECEG